MAKKIYDIKPPKATKKVVRKPKAIVVEREEKIIEKPIMPAVAEKEVVAKKPATRKPEKKKSFVMPIAIGSAVVVLGVLGFLYVKLPKVDVKIWPKLETLSAEEQISADKEMSLVDITKKVIPAKYLEITKDSTEEFPSTGSADDSAKASGTVVISNKMNPPSSLTLKVGTHLMSDSGKLFVTTQKVVVPAGKKSGSKIIPGTIEVGVKAVEGGTSYNIAPSNFSIPGLKGTAYYFNVSATSKVAFTGGVDGKVKKVTDDDLQNAKDVLVKKLSDASKDELKKQIGEEYVLLDNAIITDTTTASSEVKAGTVAQTFKYKVAVKAGAVVFKKSDIDEYAKELLVSKLAEGKTLLDSTLKADYTAKSVDISDGKVALDLKISSDTYEAIDKNSVSMTITGENETQIKDTINNLLQDNIEKIQVKFWPFWVNSAPKNQKAVHIFLEFK